MENRAMVFIRAMLFNYFMESFLWISSNDGEVVMTEVARKLKKQSTKRHTPLKGCFGFMSLNSSI